MEMVHRLSPISIERPFAITSIRRQNLRNDTDDLGHVCVRGDILEAVNWVRCMDTHRVTTSLSRGTRTWGKKTGTFPEFRKEGEKRLYIYHLSYLGDSIFFLLL